jgi:hypothetical protein
MQGGVAAGSCLACLTFSHLVPGQVTSHAGPPSLRPGHESILAGRPTSFRWYAHTPKRFRATSRKLSPTITTTPRQAASVAIRKDG